MDAAQPFAAARGVVLPRNWATAAGITAALALAVGWPLLIGNPFFITLGTTIALELIGATSLHLLLRMGHISLAHAAFMGIGGYTAVLLRMRMDVPFPFDLIAGALAPALLALVIGPVILRLSGKYFALVTFMSGEIVRLSLTQWSSLTGGANGIFGVPPLVPGLTSGLQFYYLAVLISAVCIALVARLLTGEIGRVMASIRESERLAACSGIPVVRVKVTVFAIASAMVGMQGVLHAHHLHYIDPSAFTSVQSLNFLVMNIIGGADHLIGAVAGAVFLVILPELLRDYQGLQQILFGIILVIVMAGLPGGLVQLIGLGWRAALDLRRRFAA